MATIHRATISPTKAELLTDWVPAQPWGAAAVEIVGAYRFDDPDGAVGIETIVVRTGDGALLQVPLTYRGGVLPGAEQHLVCVMEHSVLGRRWVYDGCADPVYVRVLAAVLRGSASQAEEFVDGATEPREPSVRVRLSGSSLPDAGPVDTVVASSNASSTSVVAGDLHVVVHRRLAVDTVAPEIALVGTWAGVEQPVLLVSV